MQRYNISTGSITYAIKGRDYLRKNGIKANIERKTSSEEGSGCGYSIIVSGDIEKIEEILKKANVKILKINPVAI